MTLLCCCISTHLTLQVSQGSAATDLRWGETFNKLLFHSSFLNIVVKKLRKSVHICQSYRKNKSGTFFMDHGVYILRHAIGVDWRLPASPGNCPRRTVPNDSWCDYGTARVDLLTWSINPRISIKGSFFLVSFRLAVALHYIIEKRGLKAGKSLLLNPDEAYFQGQVHDLGRSFSVRFRGAKPN